MARSIETCHDRAVVPMRTARLHLAALAAFALAACDDSGGISVITGDGTFDPEVLDFGPRPVGDVYTEPAVIRNLGAGEATIRDRRFDPASDVFSPRLADGGTLVGTHLRRNDRKDFVVLFAPTEERDYSTTMIVSLGDVEVALPIKAFGRNARPAEVAVDPGAITFVDVAVGRDVFNTVRVTNAGEISGVLREIRPTILTGRASPFTVTALGGGRAVPSEPISGDGAEHLDLEVHFAPRMVGTFEERFQLSFDRGEPAELYVSGASVPAGLLTCDHEMIDFGLVARGTVLRQAVHCTVAGGQWVLSRAGVTESTSPSFRVIDVPSTIAPDGTLDFTVEYLAQGLASRHAGAVELVAEHGAITRITLAGETTPPPAGATDLTVSLRWSTQLTDFDIHLVRNGASPFDTSHDCYFAMKNPDWGQAAIEEDDPFLDRDATEGFGPEIVNLTESAEQVYDVYVHYYAYTTSSAAPSTLVTIDYAIRGGPSQASTVTMSSCGSMWRAGRFRFDVDPPRFEGPDSAILDTWKSRASPRCQ